MNLPNNFIKRLREKKVIPFVGAGVSVNVKSKDGNSLFPNWRDLLLDAAQKLNSDGKEAAAKLVEGYLGVNPPNYLEAARIAQTYLGSELYDLIKEKVGISFRNVNQSTLIIPQAIWEISNDLIVTTNYDKTLSWSCTNSQDLSIWNIESKKEQADLIRTQFVNHPTVWHLHGIIDDVRNIILTPNGYETLYPTGTDSKTKYDSALTTLRTLFISHTFLFIGFSLDDEYFVNQLRYIQNLFQGTTNKHYVLIRETENKRLNSLNLGIEPITFESFGDKMLEKLYEIRNAADSREIKQDIQEKHIENLSEDSNSQNRTDSPRKLELETRIQPKETSQEKQDIEITLENREPFIVSHYSADDETKSVRVIVKNIGNKTLPLKVFIDLEPDTIPFIRAPLTLLNEPYDGSPFVLYSGEKRFVNLLEWRKAQSNVVRLILPPGNNQSNTIALLPNLKPIFVVIVLGDGITPHRKRFAFYVDKKGLQFEEVVNINTQSKVESNSHSDNVIVETERGIHPSIPLDQSSLYGYITSSARVRALDKQIAEMYDIELKNESSASLLEKAQRLGIKDIAELDRLVKEYGELGIRMGYYQRPQQKWLLRGFSIQLVFDVMIAQLGSVEKINEFYNSLEYTSGGWGKDILDMYEKALMYNKTK